MKEYTVYATIDVSAIVEAIDEDDAETRARLEFIEMFPNDRDAISIIDIEEN